MIPHVRWSYSAVSAFEKCPRQYNEVRLLKKYNVDTPQTREGLRVHKLFEERLLGVKPLPPEWAHYEPRLQQFFNILGSKLPEHVLKLDTHGYPTTEQYEYWVMAIIDLLIVQEKRAFIVDFKTGKSVYADTQQNKLGALLVFAHYPAVETVDAMLWFIKDDKPVPTTYYRADILKYWEQFMPGYVKLRNARHNGVFNAKPSGLCKVCPVKTCEHYRGA